MVISQTKLKNNQKCLPEEFLPILVPSDRVDRLYRAVATVEHRMLPLHPVLRHRHAGHHHGGVNPTTVQG